jgi:hypothetical protein
MKTTQFLNVALNPHEIHALRDYMKPGGAVGINNSLRGKRPMNKKEFEQITLLLKGMQKIPQVPISMDGFHHCVYRESSHFPGGITTPKELVKSQIYIEQGFLSTSSDRFGVLPDQFKISIIRPKYGRDISAFGSTKSNELEDEVLFPPNTAYKYLGFDGNLKRHIFTTDIKKSFLSSPSRFLKKKVDG